LIQVDSGLWARILCSVLLHFWIAVLPLTATAQNRAAAATPETVLVRNVTLVDQEGKKEDAIVNILIRDSKLDVVTQEEIAADNAKLALDAQKGILLGKLNLGEPANFIIIAGDPREDFQVLLDKTEAIRLACVHATTIGLARVLPGYEQVEPLGDKIFLRNIRGCRSAGSHELAVTGQQQRGTGR